MASTKTHRSREHSFCGIGGRRKERSIFINIHKENWHYEKMQGLYYMENKIQTVPAFQVQTSSYTRTEEEQQKNWI